jgi:L-alanine-DL-glutamate epimerase-like enolase superfamily enzyme
LLGDAHLVATIPDHHCHALWACQYMLTVDIAGGSGPRNVNGHLHLPEAPGPGVKPDEDAPGSTVAIY